MIERLFIQNYAIIDRLELEFGKGFHVFTGETGAGKSIIIGALGLLLGEKGDTSVVRTGEEKALIEAEFSVSADTAKKLRELEVDSPETLIIRREIVQNGKNRVFINGLQEPLSKLEAIGEWLVDIHGQHDHQLLLAQKVHMDILDAYGNHAAGRSSCGALYNDLRKKLEYQKELSQDEEKLLQEKVFWETAVKEINALEATDEEEAELRESIRRMENAENLARAFTEAHDIVYESEHSVTAKMSRAVNALKDTAGLDRRYEELLSILEDAQAKIDESASLLSDYRDELEYDEKKMETMIDRMELMKDLKRKYHKNSMGELQSYAADCALKLKKFENKGEELVKVNAEIKELKEKLITEARALSEKRQATARTLSERIKSELSYLGMEKAEFIVDIKYVREDSSPFIIQNIPIKISDTGMDRVEFFISSNAGEEPRPLRKVASGGEISRVMLALKTIFAGSDSVETLVFDEIDTGIGGLTANNVAEKMKAMADSRQLFVITHLPQIASRAGSHYTVSKETRDGKTFTRVDRIDGDPRVAEIARMLGGDGAAASAHAREMLGR